jgi:hypothetical protein
MRTRSKTNAYIHSLVPPFNQEWVGHGSYTVSAGSNVDELVDTEYMSDDDDKSHRFKEVIHRKKKLERSNIASTTLVSGTNTFISSGSNCFWHEWGLGSHDFVNHDHVPVRFSVSEEQLLRNTLDAFYNTNEVDSLLNLVESPELVTGISSLRAKLSNIARITGVGRISSRESLKRLFSRRSLKNQVAAVSSGYLYYKFGVAPIAADIRKIGSGLKTYSKRLKSVVANAGQDISVHRSALGAVMPFGHEGTNLPSGFGSSPDTDRSWTATLKPWSVVPSLTCTVRGVRENKYFGDFFQKLDFLASRFGSVGPASFLWERIPFSFVVDWFVDLSGVLNYLDNALTGNTKKVKEACISTKWDVIAEIYKLRYNTSLTSSVDGAQIAQCRLGFYHRKLVDPHVSVGLNVRFGKSQASITAALVAQMAANLRSKR